MSKEINFHEPLSEADTQYVKDRPWLIQDAELNGIEVQLFDPELDYEDEEEEDEEDVDDGYPDLNVGDLEKLIKERNAQPDRNAETVIQPESHRKDDLIAALRADDAADEDDE
jgi:hypothetical protein